MKNKFLFAALSALTLTACTFEKAEPFVEECPDTMLFQTDIKPIFDAKCVTCHFPGGTGMGDFTQYSEIKAKVDAGILKNRVFILKDMPPGGNPQLTEAELQKLKCWMEQGAPNN